MSGVPVQDYSTFQGMTKVISPVMIHFSNASLGDVFSISLHEENVVLLNSSGDILGSINPAWITELIYNIKKGKSYGAVISYIMDSSIDVTIKRL